MAQLLDRFRVTTGGLDDKAAEMLDRYGVCVVDQHVSYADCVSHLAVVEKLYGALPRPACPHWPPPPGWLHDTLLPSQRVWLTAAGLHAAALDRRRHGIAAHLREGPGCHLGKAWAWRAAVLDWFEQYHGEPCVATIEPVWVQIPKLCAVSGATRNRIAVVGPYPTEEFGTGQEASAEVPALLGCAVGERPDAGPPVQPHFAQHEPAWTGLRADGSGDHEEDLSALASLAWTDSRERPVRAMVCVSSVGEFCLALTTERDRSVSLSLVQGDLLLWDPSRWRPVNATAHCHPSDRMPGSAKAFVWQPIGSHPVRLEPNTVEERIRSVTTGRRPALAPDGRDAYPLAHDALALVPLTGEPVPRGAAQKQYFAVETEAKDDRDDGERRTDQDIPLSADEDRPLLSLAAPACDDLEDHERQGWTMDGVVSRAMIDRNPAYWRSVLRGSRVLVQTDRGAELYIVENAGVLSSPFTDAQRTQSMDSACLFGLAGDALPAPRPVQQRRRAGSGRTGGPLPGVKAVPRSRQLSEKLEADAGPLDPSRLGWAASESDLAWAGTASDVLLRLDAARALGLRLAPLRWGPRALGCRPWLQALSRLKPETAQKLRVAHEVTESLRDAFEAGARGEVAQLTEHQPLQPLQPLWKLAPARRIVGADAEQSQGPGQGGAGPRTAGAVLCPWGLPVAVLAGCSTITGGLVDQLTQGDPRCVVVTIPDAADMLNDAEQAVRDQLATVPSSVRRCGASVVLVLPTIGSPSTLLSPDCGPVVALAVLLAWVDPWLQAHFAHRLAAWSMACLAPCLEPAGVPVPFRTLAAPSLAVLDHLRVTRVQQWKSDQLGAVRGMSKLAQRAAVLLRQVRTTPTQLSGPACPGRETAFALLPPAKPYSAAGQKTMLKLPPSLPGQSPRQRRHRATSVHAGQAVAGVPEDSGETTQENVSDAGPAWGAKRRRRAVDPRRYSRDKQLQYLVDRIKATAETDAARFL